MFRTGLEAVVSAFLEGALHDVDLQEVPCFFPEEDLLLDLHWISELCVFFYLLAGLYPALMKHDAVSREGLHHGPEESAVEHEGRFVDEAGHYINQIF